MQICRVYKDGYLSYGQNYINILNNYIVFLIYWSFLCYLMKKMGKTRGVHETTPEIRNRMVGMYEAGLGLREIAAAVNCSQRTVKRWLNRFDKEGNVETRERCGRKRATTQEQDEAIIRLATQTPITAAKAVLPVLGLNCSVDTVRERLHKAGIHNWSPSRKHIQKIPVAISDEIHIHQSVWRPTGTHLGKKKLAKEGIKTKKTNLQFKKKIASRKTKSKEVLGDNNTISNTLQQSEEQSGFIFLPSIHTNNIQSQITEIQPLPPPLPTAVSSTNLGQCNHPLNLIPQPQALYQANFNLSQNWPPDLINSTHHYTPDHQNLNQQYTSLLLQTNSELHDHHNIQFTQMQSSVQSNENISQRKADGLVVQHGTMSDLPQEKLNESQEIIINVCSDVCSNSNSSSSCNENSQNSSTSNRTSNTNSDSKQQKKNEKLLKKKGGKAKGTLETSIEIRNRMIGMSEAGLSTLSIALAINRSERTVKRWLDRWCKEGNVQTKERKGRKRITTKEQDDAIVAMATQQPLTAAKHVAPALGLKCSVDTIRERLHKAGIHSWKLGKKQGEGNIIQTVHVWQPSGNRSIKIKTNENKKKKSTKKFLCMNKNNVKQKNKKQSIVEKQVIPSTSIMLEEPNNTEHYQNQSESSVLLQINDGMSASLTSIQSQTESRIPTCSQGLTSSQTALSIESITQQRSDCRLALTALTPTISNQANTNNNLIFPPCMMGNSTHVGHTEQSDPMNYEPYIWNF